MMPATRQIDVQSATAAMQTLHVDEHSQAKLNAFNRIPVAQTAQRRLELQQLLSSVGIRSQINSPFYCWDGSHIDIGRNTMVASDVAIVDEEPVTIGNHVLISQGVQILAHAAPQATYSQKVNHAVVIEDDVWIGARAIIRAGVTIGRGAIIAAGADVTCDIPAGAFASGTPAKILLQQFVGSELGNQW